MSTNYEDWSREDLIAKLRSLQPTENTACTNINTTTNNKRKQSLLPSSSTPPTPVSKKKRKTGQREFDHTKFATRKVAFRVAYYGWPYHGFASQGNSDPGVVTVEDVLLESLMRTKLIVDPSNCDFSRCGRTDRGVSGLGQVVALKVRSALPKNHPDVLEYKKATETESTLAKTETEDGTQEASSKETSNAPTVTATVDTTEELHYVDILNRVLPDTIRVLAWAPVHKNFSARFNCKSRTYKYFFTKELLDIDLMKDAASRLVGEHDFRNFCKLDKSGGITTFSRRVVSIEIRPVAHFQASNSEDQMFELVLCGSAFLYHQVRCIMAVLFMVGQRHEKPNIVDRLLNVDEMPTKPIYDLADEIPLVLYDSEYKDTLDWRYTGTKDDPQHSLSMVTHMRSHLNEQWQKHTIKAALFREGMAILDNFTIPLPSSDSTSTDDPVVTTYSDAVVKIRESIELMLPSQENQKRKNQNITPLERAKRVLDYRSHVVLGGGTSKSIGKCYVPIENRARTELYVDKAAKFKEKNDEKKAARQAAAASQNAKKKRETES